MKEEENSSSIIATSYSNQPLSIGHELRSSYDWETSLQQTIETQTTLKESLQKLLTLSNNKSPLSSNNNNDQQTNYFNIDPIFETREEFMTFAIKEIPKLEILHSYDLNMEIGEGATSTVYHAVKKDTNQDVAIKKMKNTPHLLKMATREANALSHLHHPSIVKLIDAFQTPDHIYIVMQYIYGVPLFDFMINNGVIKEERARNISQQIISAIQYMHERGIIHRDIKPENIMIGDDDKICIIDFGTVNCIPEDELYLLGGGGGGGGGMNYEPSGISTPVGTLGYQAPELFLKQKYTFFVDIWAFGVMLYTMLCGIPPFVSDRSSSSLLSPRCTADLDTTTAAAGSGGGGIPFWCYINQETASLKQEVINGQLDFSSNGEWLHASPTVKSFISKLLIVNVKHRISAKQAINDPWFSGGGGNTSKLPSSSLSSSPSSSPHRHSNRKMLMKSAPAISTTWSRC